jgi:CBS domain-containing protein
MRTVADVLCSKSPGGGGSGARAGGAACVVTVESGISIRSAAKLMNDRHIGSLVVVDGPSMEDAEMGIGAVRGSRIRGILTERDILVRVVAGSRDPDRTTVEEVMTAECLTCRPHTSLAEARQAMRERRIRHLPAINDRGLLVGMISIGDLNVVEHDELEETIHVMQAYIAGETL